ncbi:MAG: hypothetical protein Q8Q86_01685, partial [Candidatus Daviesbacteria bacterium]|nr:hypothetical protein [Candidatus Daviesbacteria bacterium]
RFSPSPFLERTIGYLASVQRAVHNREVFEVAETSHFLGDQAINARNAKGELLFGLQSADLFTAA